MDEGLDSEESWDETQADELSKKVDAAKARRVLLGGACATALGAGGWF